MTQQKISCYQEIKSLRPKFRLPKVDLRKRMLMRWVNLGKIQLVFRFYEITYMQIEGLHPHQPEV